MELRSLLWLLLAVLAVIVAAAYWLRRRRMLARARARPAVIGPTPEEEAYLDSSHIVGPITGKGAAPRGGDSPPRSDGR